MLALPASPLGAHAAVPALGSIAMRKFVLIDHSLKNIGGHHFSYAREFVGAARRAGFEPVLATHRRFREAGAIAEACTVLPLFHHESYSPLTFDMQAYRPGVQRAARSQGVAAAWRTYRRTRLARAFASDCRTLFDRVRLTAGDRVFLATASEIDLAGLGAFLRSARTEPGVDWHVQFHFGIFQGRDPDYGAQAEAEQAVREIFEAALAGLVGLRLHCYCTTEALSAQYRRLGVAPIQTLPYPVNSDIRNATPAPASAEPIRIACLGHSRREKGLGALAGIIGALWNPYLRDNRAQLLVQTHRRRARRALSARIAAQGAHGASPPLLFAPFPLDLAGYAELVRSAGIGLLLYDGARYYARCSGVLLELLCAGVPVVVPAGCWLAEQIAEANQSYLDTLARGARRLVAAADAPATLQFGLEPALLERALTEECTQLLVRFRITAGAGAGRYYRLELLQLDGAGAPLPSDPLGVMIVGARALGATCVAFALDPRARSLRLRAANAWHEELTTVGEIECLAHVGQRHPLAAVGLAVHEPAQAAAALAQILQHYGHYRRSAAALASRCAAYHNADRLVAQLTGAAALEAEYLRPAMAAGH
jgi:hypothetical protein